MKIQLRQAQEEAVRWAKDVLTREGGVLFSDATGYGKSYQALALVQRLGARPVIFAPKAIVPMWETLLRTYGIQGRVLRYGQLHDREHRLDTESEIAIIDEAHHFVHPHTRRFQALARHVFGVRCILLTATPFQNRAEDGLHLLSLFSSEAMWAIHHARYANEALIRLMRSVSIGRSQEVQRPHTRHDYRVTAPVTDLQRMAGLVCVDAEPYALMVHWLVSRYLSSYEAWSQSYERTERYIRELHEAVTVGRYVTRDMFQHTMRDGQRTFAFMMPMAPSQAPDAAALEHILRELMALRTTIAQRPHRGWDWLLQRPRPVVVFSRYIATIDAIYYALRGSARLIRWTGNCIDANWPMCNAPIHTQLENSLLLATDIAAEGIDLRTCRTLVHADLHWNPSRTVQREGRVLRGAGETDVEIWTPFYSREVTEIWHLVARTRYKAGLSSYFPGKVLDEDIDTSGCPQRQIEDGPSAAYCSSLLSLMRKASWLGGTHGRPWLQQLMKMHMAPAGASAWVRKPADALREKGWNNEQHKRIQAIEARLRAHLEWTSTRTVLD